MTEATYDVPYDVCAKETVKQVHWLVAVYDTLQGLLEEELEKYGLLTRETADSMTTTQTALDKLEKTVAGLRDSLGVKKVSEGTVEREDTIARIVSNANRQITLEAVMLKGMKSKSEPGTGKLR